MQYHIQYHIQLGDRICTDTGHNTLGQVVRESCMKRWRTLYQPLVTANICDSPLSAWSRIMAVTRHQSINAVKAYKEISQEQEE